MVVSVQETSITRLQTFYGALDAPLLLRAMIKEEFPGQIALLTSFGSDAALLLALVAEVDPATPVLFLETGKHFTETLDYARTLEAFLGLARVIRLTPDAAKLTQHDPGGDLWNRQPNRCCWLRKVEPLERALREYGFKALITGRKRYQTPERAEMCAIEKDGEGTIRVNPLAEWSREKVKGEFQRRHLPEHPLVAGGYKSIGCAPCTAAVGAGQDERAGRWAHTIGLDEERKTECGIHLPGSMTADWSV